MVQCRSIIRTVSCYRYHRTFLLQQLHQTLFICRTRTRHYFQIHHTVKRFFICQFCKGSSCYPVTFRIFRFPQTNLTCYFRSRTRCIPRNNLYINTGRLAFRYRRRHILTNRITDSNHTQERQIMIGNQFHTISCIRIFYDLESKTKGTHRHVLITQQLFFYRRAILYRIDPFAIQNNIFTFA